MSKVVSVARDVMVTMRDGVRLATDVYFPGSRLEDLDDPLPVILVRTPYNKVELEQDYGWAEYFAVRDYVAVVQDCRGCFRSEGEVDFLWPEATDGYDTMAWIVDQPWCDGRIGTWGVSWSGWTQTAAAALNAPGLASMVPTMSGANALESSVRHGGALEIRFVAWAIWHAAANPRPEQPPHTSASLNHAAPSMQDWLRRMPLRKGVSQLAQTPAYERWAFEIATCGDDSARWQHPSTNPVGHLGSASPVPTLVVGGWYDSYTQASFQLFNAMVGRGEPTHLIMGPWVHGGRATESSHAGDIEFDHDAALESFRDLHLDWFNATLKGESTSSTQLPPIRLFVMGGGSGAKSGSGRLQHGGHWRDEHEWPLARTIWQPLYLHGDGGLGEIAPTDPLSSTTFLFNPADPVPTIGGGVSSLSELAPLPPGIADVRFAKLGKRLTDIVAPGGYDQRERAGIYGCTAPYLPLAARADVLVFETDPLPEPVEVTGPIRVELWVSTTATDTDFTVKLVDVYPASDWHPSGYALNLTDSILRLRYRDGPRAVSYESSSVVRVEIQLYPTSNLFATGHRIRVDVSSSNFPRFDVNPNTGAALWQERVRRPAENTIYHDASHPSHVVLPVIPYGSFAPTR